MKTLFRYLLSALLLVFLLPACTETTASQEQSADAQGPAGPDTAGPVLNHIALYVHELEKSSEFYEQVMQLPKIPEPFNDGLHEWFSIGSSQLHLIAGAPQGREHFKKSHLCFSVVSIEDFIKRLDEYGIDYSNLPGDSRRPTVRPDGVKQIYLQDPDGHWIEINNDR